MGAGRGGCILVEDFFSPFVCAGEDLAVCDQATAMEGRGAHRLPPSCCCCLNYPAQCPSTDRRLPLQGHVSQGAAEGRPGSSSRGVGGLLRRSISLLTSLGLGGRHRNQR